MADELVSVKFTKKRTPYQAGDLAGFPAVTAQRFVEGGVAVYKNPPPGLDEFGKPIEEEEPSKKGGRKASAKKEDSVSDEKEKAELEKRKTGDPGTVKK